MESIGELNNPTGQTSSGSPKYCDRSQVPRSVIDQLQSCLDEALALTAPPASLVAYKIPGSDVVATYIPGNPLQNATTPVFPASAYQRVASSRAVCRSPSHALQATIEPPWPSGSNFSSPTPHQQIDLCKHQKPMNVISEEEETGAFHDQHSDLQLDISQPLLGPTTFQEPVRLSRSQTLALSVKPQGDALHDGKLEVLQRRIRERLSRLRQSSSKFVRTMTSFCDRQSSQ